MTNSNPITIFAFVGLAGSGKSSAVDYMTKKGYPHIYFGGIIYDAMKEAGIEITWDSQQQFREDIREREGKDFVVIRAIKQIRKLIETGEKLIVLDGLYTWSEYKILKQEFLDNLVVAAVVTPKHLRYKRMEERAERPMQPHEVDARDWAEIEKIEKGGPIAIADYFLQNDTDLDHLYRQIDNLLGSVSAPAEPRS